MIFDNCEGGKNQSGMWQFIGRFGYGLLFVFVGFFFTWGLQRLLILLGID